MDDLPLTIEAAWGDATPPAGRVNLPEYTVSELSQALKRAIEDGFGFVRVRGEVSGWKRHGSGHCYFALKDSDAVIDAVCWRGTASRLDVRPEDGMEVVCSGRLTTYASRSKYQLVVERIELAGIGALLKLLEERRQRLMEEGLFAAERKKKLPFLPEVIGIVTSPTGAVIRDILHRLADRFPRRVLVWPVAVQGEGAAAQVTAAIAGFNRLRAGETVPRPDLLIIARGGGSLEDLMAFNEEIVVRAAAASAIPLISAVGHETDTTLIDHAADRRAPTPTAAAEMAVPVRADLMAQTLDFGKRTIACMNRVLREATLAVTGLARGLGDPLRLIEERQQRLDVSGERLALATRGLVERRGQALAAARLISPVAVLVAKQQALTAEVRVLEGAMRRYVGDTRQKIERTSDRLEQYVERLQRCGAELLERGRRQVDQLGKLLESYSFHSVLQRGFALVRDQDDHPVLAAADTRAGDTLGIEFADGKIGARVTEGAGAAPRPAPPPRRRDSGSGGQGSLL